MIVTARILAALCVALGIGWWLQAEEYAAFWLVASIALLRWLLPAFLPNRREWALFSLETTLLFAGFVIGFWIGRTIRYQRSEFFDLHTVVRWAGYAWVVSIVAGSVVGSFINRWSLRRRRRGPWCPGCGYSLIGTSERRCPECGRAFTLAELRVSETELHPPAHGTAGRRT